MRKEIIKITDVFIDDEIYPRESLSQALVNKYRNDMKFGTLFPAIFVAKFKGKHYLVDGLHRLKAKEDLGDKFVEADVIDNFASKLDIYLASIRANLNHGKALTHKDKIKVAKQLKKMNVGLSDIDKLLHIGNKDLDKLGIGNLSDLQKLKVTNKNFNLILKDRKEDIKETQEIKTIISPEDEQCGELVSFFEYVDDTKFIHNKDNRKLLLGIYIKIGKILSKMKK